MNLSDLNVDRALVVGDMHGNLFSWERTILPAFARTHSDIIVQVGDFGYGWNVAGRGSAVQQDMYLTALDELLDSFGARVLWLDGNHENFDLLEEIGAFGAAEPFPTSERTTYIPRGYAWEWRGKMCMALGGAYSVDKHYRTPHRSWWPQEEITHTDLERAKRRLAEVGGELDVLFAHDSFTGIRAPGIHADWKQDEFAAVCKPNRDMLRDIVDRTHLDLYIHGHYHVAYEQSSWPGVDTIIGLNAEDATGSCITLDFPSLEWERAA